MKKFALLALLSLVLAGCGEKTAKSSQNNNKICQESCGDGVCQEIVCLAIGCPCAESAKNCPADCGALSPAVDPTSDWEDYKNVTYKFTVKKPRTWRVEEIEYDPAKVTSGILHSTNFTEESDAANRKVYFSFDIWPEIAATEQIVSNRLAGLSFKAENKLVIGDLTGQELIYYGPSRIFGGNHDYRLFIVKTAKFVYALYSDFCLDNKQAECDQFVSRLNFNAN